MKLQIYFYTEQMSTYQQTARNCSLLATFQIA